MHLRATNWRLFIFRTSLANRNIFCPYDRLSFVCPSIVTVYGLRRGIRAFVTWSLQLGTPRLDLCDELKGARSVCWRLNNSSSMASLYHFLIESRMASELLLLLSRLFGLVAVKVSMTKTWIWSFRTSHVLEMRKASLGPLHSKAELRGLQSIFEPEPR